MDEALRGHHAARAGIDIACHDWIGKRLGVPLWRFLGGDLEALPLSSYTVAMGGEQAVSRALEHGRGFRVVKVKMGDPGDRERLRAVRAATDLPIWVDANGGWRFEDALERLPELTAAGVSLLEQPLMEDDLRGCERLRARLAMPLVADEPARTARDLPRLAGSVDGINIKLAKCGGVWPAMRMVHTARALGLRILVGCMVESSIGIAAAAAVSSFADWADLDGFRLVDNDPGRGLELAGGCVRPGDAPGLGVRIESTDVLADA
jgi:L-alanine-DL-glutamate epimerase-like enolase superfamily enzyme